jgi:lipoprotein-anchoring transpeptidase ErfK/SrfK
MHVNLPAMQACVYRGKSFIDSRYYQMNYLFRGLSARHFYLVLSLLLLGWTPARADFLWFKQQQKAQVAPPSQLLGKQQPAVFNREVYDRMNAENISILVSLSRQRLYASIGEDVAIDSPISSGKAARRTPSGSFTVLEKDPNHHSSVYGNFVDSSGRVVRGGVSALIDAAPSGTHFAGAPMKWFMRLTWEGVGMHVGILPGYAASHGCIRLPADVAEALYTKVKVGTPVKVVD